MRKAFCAALLLAAFTSPSWGQTSGSPTIISVCVGTLTGIPREVPSSKDCLRGLETFQQWDITGPQGPAGPQGAQGVQGPQGIQGPQGTAGAQGPAGPAGATGSQGLPGATGSQGAVGATGTPGAVGPTGAQGPVGATGAPGAAGATGSQGPAGATGQQGPAGPTGSQGAVGPTGAPGTAGATGAQGPVGATGSQGTQGPAGPAGPAGPDGVTGATGAAGANGGQVWSAMTTLPSPIESNFYDFTPSGMSVPTDSTTGPNPLIVPVACTVANFQATAYGVKVLSGNPVVSLVRLDDTGATKGKPAPLPSCAFTAGGAASTCTSSTTVSLNQGERIALTIGTFLESGEKLNATQTSYAGAKVYVSFTCQ